MLIYLSHAQSLSFSKEWIKGEYYELGGYSQELFFHERKTLEDGKLNLGAFGGFQQLYYKDSFSRPLSIQLRADLNTNGFFYLFFKDDQGTRLGVRISRLEMKPSAYVSVSPEGKFITKELLHGLPVRIHNQIEARIVDDGLELLVNGTKMELPVVINKASHYRVGFQGGVTYEEDHHLGSVYISELKISSDKTVNVDFGFMLRADRSIPLFIISFFLIYLIQLIPMRGTTTVVVLLSCAVLYIIIDYFVLKNLFFDFSRVDRVGKYDTFVSSEYKLKKKIWQEEIEKHKPDNVKRKVLFMGGSKTEGIGALHVQDAWISQLEKLCQQATHDKIFFLNAGISKASTVDFELYYDDLLNQFRPDDVVFHVGINDLQPGITTRLSYFITKNRKRGIRTILSPEFVFYDYFMPSEYYDKLKRLAEKNRDVIWLRSYHLIQQEILKDEGIYWADAVHLSSFGQKKFAKILFPEMVEILKLNP